MTIDAKCPGCGRVYHVDESKAGRSGKCKDCGSTFQVPELDYGSNDFDDDFGDLASDGEPMAPAPRRTSSSASSRRSKAGSKKKSGGGGGTGSKLGLIIGGVVVAVLILCGGGGYFVISALPKVREAARAKADKNLVWSRFEVPNGKFSCEMPTGAIPRSQSAGPGLTAKAWVRKTASMEITVGFMDISHIPSGQFDVDAALKGGTAGGAAAVNGTILSDVRTTIQNHPAQEYEISARGMTIHGVTIVANNRMILMNVVYPNGSPPNDSERIFDTLVIE
ncbi:MAG: hypothetical protein R3C01_04415 [Planctomycetaceae bacterium]